MTIVSGDEESLHDLPTERAEWQLDRRSVHPDYPSAGRTPIVADTAFLPFHA